MTSRPLFEVRFDGAACAIVVVAAGGVCIGIPCFYSCFKRRDVVVGNIGCCGGQLQLIVVDNDGLL